MFKYDVKSVCELYDKCTAEEWSELIYVGDIAVHKHLNIALEMYIKECLNLQRNDRWVWLCKYAEYNGGEVNEFKRLFATQNIDIKKFSNDVYDLLRCTEHKRNCLRLWGVANSGKSLIAQLIASVFISAYVNNHNSENEFFLSCFLNTAIALCEEMFVTQATAEDMKSIMGGAPLLVSKKYTAKQILSRTPIIITSNHALFGRGHLAPVDENALKIRCFSYNFTTQFVPKMTLSVPALAYLIYVSCDRPNKSDFL